MAAAALIGFTIGLLDLAITTILQPLWAESDLLLVTILSWVPYIALLFAGVVLLAKLVKGMLTRVPVPSRLLGIGLAAMIAILYAYNVGTVRSCWKFWHLARCRRHLAAMDCSTLCTVLQQSSLLVGVVPRHRLHDGSDDHLQCSVVGSDDPGSNRQLAGRRRSCAAARTPGGFAQRGNPVWLSGRSCWLACTGSATVDLCGIGCDLVSLVKTVVSTLNCWAQRRPFLPKVVRATDGMPGVPIGVSGEAVSI